MPPATRRTTRGTAPAKQQSKIAFASKITKRTDSVGKDVKSQLASRSKLSQVEIPKDVSKPDVVTLDDGEDEVVVKVGGKGNVEEVNEQEIEAKEVDDSAIKKYWRDREAERITPRGNLNRSCPQLASTNMITVHQEGVTMEEKILRLFDMSSQYGPCIGIPRIARWHRAYRLGLKPPIEVLAVLVKNHDNGKVLPKAHLEELLATKAVADNAA